MAAQAAPLVAGVVIAALLGISPVAAQAPAPTLPPTTTYPGGARFFARPQATMPGVGTVMVEGPSFNHQAALRTESGEVERHADWNDTILIIEGRGVEWLGGETGGAVRTTAPGEFRGGNNAGAAAQPFGPGDAIFIPAGTLHRMEVRPGAAPVRYFTFKSRR